MPYDRIDLSKIKTYPLGQRPNLVKLADLVRPCDAPPAFENEELPLVARAIRKARADGRPVLWMLGAHVVKSGLSLLVIDLMMRGLVTHVAGNGAVTIHVTIGTDIIHQHPAADFGALGAASGLDFRAYCATVAKLEGGVFCNFGSAVTGPEVFLKALSIARNLGHTVSRITTANFDLFPLRGDVHAPVGKDDIEYYYRPRKNIVNRPTSLGGQGFHIRGDHAATIPNLYHLLVD